MATIEHTLEPRSAAAGRASCCAAIAPATSAGSSHGMARSMRRNMAGTSPSRRWSPRSLRSSSDRSTLRASTAGSPNSAASRSARSFWSRHSDEVAKLRLLLVEKKARGLGVGRRADRAMHPLRARMPAIASITLWTQSILVAARGIYQRAGFRRVAKRRTTVSAQSRRRDLGVEAFRRRNRCRIPGSLRSRPEDSTPTRPSPSGGADVRPAAA